MTTQDAIVTIQTGPFIFVKHLENVWVEQDGRFRLERQEFDFDDDQLTHDWGVWDTLTENWAHPETGYARKQQALNAFLNAWADLPKALEYGDRVKHKKSGATGVVSGYFFNDDNLRDYTSINVTWDPTGMITTEWVSDLVREV